MEKKRTLFLGTCVVLLLFSGCNANKSKEIKEDHTVQAKHLEEMAEELPETETAKENATGFEKRQFPSYYEKKSASGKVKFQCNLEIPENFQDGQIKELLVNGENFGDRQKAYAAYVEGKDIKETHSIPGDKQYPPEDVYIFSDGGDVSIGNGFSFGTVNAQHYLYIGAMNPDNRQVYESSPVSFLPAQDVIQRIKEVLGNCGFSGEEFEFHVYPLHASISKQIEEQYIAEGKLQSDKQKGEWTPKDDAYAIYAYQTKNGFPIYHELLSIGKQLAFDTADAAPVCAIYSSRGLESIRVYCVYDLTETENAIELKDFDEIAKVVERKFEDILDDSSYVVERAKLYERVSRNEKQEYVTEPIWYFEIADNKGNKSVTLVSAVTAKEIFLS